MTTRCDWTDGHPAGFGPGPRCRAQACWSKVHHGGTTFFCNEHFNEYLRSWLSGAEEVAKQWKYEPAQKVLAQSEFTL